MNTILREEGYPLALRETYLAMIRNSVGSMQYRMLFVQTPRDIVDVIGNGDLACAFFVSSILMLCGLTKGGVHTTVDATVDDLEQSGWRRQDELLPEGSVLIWEPKLCSDNLRHRHIGFYVGDGMAISNSSEERSPALHRLCFNEFFEPPVRKVSAVYTHPRFF